MTIPGDDWIVRVWAENGSVQFEIFDPVDREIVCRSSCTPSEALDVAELFAKAVGEASR